MLLNSTFAFGIIISLKNNGEDSGLYIKNSTSPLMKLKVLYDMSEKHVNKSLIKYNLTLSQTRVMNALYISENGEHTFKELEKMFHVSQQTMAGIIQRLEMKDFVESYVDENDRRIKRVRLTKSGNAIREDIQSEIDLTEQWLTDTLEREETEKLLVILDKIYENLLTLEV